MTVLLLLMNIPSCVRVANRTYTLRIGFGIICEIVAKEAEPR